MDVLSDWLRVVDTRGVLLARSRFAAPWGIAIPASRDCMFHVVTEGYCWLRRPGAPPLALGRGDYVLLPGGEAHELLHAPDGKSEPLDVVLARRQPPESRPQGTVICGAYQSHGTQPLPLIRSLPALVHFAASEVHAHGALAAVIDLLLRELESPGPGEATLLPTLFDALLLYTLRAWGARDSRQSQGAPTHWLAALRDPALSIALERMHAAPGEPWTVESLARVAGLSRAVFAKRFSDVFGEPPLSYLTAWRMRLAANMFTESRVSLSEAATRLGYDSEFAFSRAFKRVCGVAPSVYRKQAAAARQGPSSRI